MNELKKHSLKIRVTELENRLNNLKALVDNIAFNQEQIVKAFEVDAEEVKPTKETLADAEEDVDTLTWARKEAGWEWTDNCTMKNPVRNDSYKCQYICDDPDCECNQDPSFDSDGGLIF